MAFKLKSGNKIPFKLMGSPMKNLLGAANNVVEQTNKTGEDQELDQELTSEQRLSNLESKVSELGESMSSTDPGQKTGNWGVNMRRRWKERRRNQRADHLKSIRPGHFGDTMFW